MCLLALLCGCSGENNTDQPDQSQTPGKVYLDTGNPLTVTRTQLQSDLSVNWSIGDEVAVIAPDGKLHSGKTLLGNSPDASFLMTTLGLVDGRIQELVSDSNPWYVTVFPKSAVTTAESDACGDVIKGVSLAREQTLVENSFDPQANVLYAALRNGGKNSGYGGDEYNGKELNFYSACALLKIEVKGSAKLKSVEIKAPEGVNMTGTGTFSCYQGGWYGTVNSNPFSDSHAGSLTGYGTVVLKAAAPVALKTDASTVFYASVIPAKTYLSGKTGEPETLQTSSAAGVKAGDYTITFTDSDGNARTKTVSLEEDTVAGKITDFGTFDLDGYWPGSDVDGKAYVTTVAVPASKMNREVKVIYIVPDNKPAGTDYPVLYLLHGASGNETDWITQKPELASLANEKGLIIVCPDGNNSWYWDSPVQSDFQYETFIYKDLVEFTDLNFPTVADRKSRAITGLSMGGQGALWNAIRHKDVFGAVGSMSGGVDVSYDDAWATRWSLADRLGSKAANLEVWKAHSIVSQLDKLSDGDLAMYIDCGTEDTFIVVNNILHDELTQRGITHEYSTRPGAHNWNFWKVSIENHLDFFVKLF